MNPSIKPRKHDPHVRYFNKPLNIERIEMLQILNMPERYDLSKLKKTPTIQTEEINKYIPEKWSYKHII